MPWYLILAAGFVLGYLAKCTVLVVEAHRDLSPINPSITITTPPRDARPKRYGAAAILGYNDGGSRYHGPTHPATRGARSQVAALAAWDRRNRKDVA